MGPCMCGDTECPSCGVAQGTYDPDEDREQMYRDDMIRINGEWEREEQEHAAEVVHRAADALRLAGRRCDR